MKPAWKLVFIFVGIFLSGAVVGSVVSVRICRAKVVPQMPPDQFGPKKMKQLTDQLDLSDEQKQKIRPIVEKAASELRDLRTDSFRSGSVVMDRMETEVLAVLTPKQQGEFKQMQEKIRARFREDMKERDRKERDWWSDKPRPPKPPPDSQTTPKK